jgi:RHS repeat-associated protein
VISLGLQRGEIGASTQGISLYSRDTAFKPELITSVVTPPPAGEFVATADAMVFNGDSTLNYGDTSDIITVLSGNGIDADGYLKFDTSSYVGALQGARIRLYGHQTSNPNTMSVSAHSVADTSWSETAITWNNKPPKSAAALSSTAISGTTDGWYEWDVTAYVTSERAAGRNVVSFAMSNPTADNSDMTTFSAREGSHAPRLLLGTDTALFFIHPDHLNTPRLVADSTGTTVWKWDQQEPFGADTPNGDPGNTGTTFDLPLRLPGQFFDKETNQHYNYLRDCYDPAIGRYCQSDPIGLDGGLNTYAYVEANPLFNSDSFGLARGGRLATQPYANQTYARASAEYLIREIQTYQPNFVPFQSVSAPNQAGYSPAMIRALQQSLLNFRQSNTCAPQYAITPSGIAFPVPQGSGRIPVVNRIGAISGDAFAGGAGGGPGLAPSVTQLRLMNPTPGNPSGYGVYMNSTGQGVNPFTGQTLSPFDPLRHIPF